MRSLLYLTGTTLKNRVLELKKKPSRLILYLFVIAMLGFVIFTSNEVSEPNPIDFSYLTGIFFVFLVFFLYTGALKGLDGGGSVFRMDDVNLLFVSPLSPRLILAYGLLKQAGLSLLIGIFIPFQATTLKTLFNVGTGGVFVLFFVYAASALISELVAMVLYSVAGDSARRKTIIKAVLFALPLPLLAEGILLSVRGTPLLDVASALCRSPFRRFFPIAGWLSEFAEAALLGDTLTAVLFLSLTLVFVGILIAIFAFSKADYYEDVLVATEATHRRQEAAKEGNTDAAANRKVKVGRSEELRGSGASALFFKHIRERFRESRIPLVDKGTVTLLALSVFFSIMLRDFFTVDYLLYFSLYMQVFFIGTSRGLRDLYHHQIFLIPDSPFRKLFYLGLEFFLKTLLDGTIVFVVVGVLLKASLLSIVMCILVRTLFTVFLYAFNMFSMRVFHGSINTGILMLLYFLAVLVITAPGIVLMILAAIFYTGPFAVYVPNLILCVWEVLVAALFLYLSRGVLDECDMAEAKR
ncbi:putative ABC exporter domain-containing protein [Oscillospiraceae bacterium OttesenSCG-928-G22]|nr:putative ABC exporter domain-containing protein [Oscillospiraceae bacterium OttesenSCG-928-G22]